MTEHAKSAMQADLAEPLAPTPGLLSGWRVVALATLASRVLGLVRDMATAGLFGLGPVMDAFAFAFRIPNLARRLFGEGALTAAFLPVFARELGAANGPVPQSAWRLANAVLSLLAVVLTGLVLAAEVILAAIGWSLRWEPDSALLIGLTQVMLPYALLICLAAQVSAVLHALGHFTWPAVVPVVLNLFWLAGVWLVSPLLGENCAVQAYAVALCIVAAGAAQLAIQLPVLWRLGFRLRPGWQSSRGPLREVVRGVLPVTLGLSITQINTVLDSLIAWSFSRSAGAGELMPLGLPLRWPLESGAVSALYFGERMYQFPLGVFGVAVSTVIFPRLARHAARGDLGLLREDLSTGLKLTLAIGLPASAGLALVSGPLTATLFEHGRFQAADAQRTAQIIATYALGVWAYCAIPVLYRGFYALGARSTPLRVGLAAVIVDQILNLALIWPLAERGLALSTALSAAVQVALLMLLLQRRIGAFDWRALRRTAWRSALATLAMSLVCLALLELLPIEGSLVARAVRLAIAVTASIGCYLLAARLFGLTDLWLLAGRTAPGAERLSTRDR